MCQSKGSDLAEVGFGLRFKCKKRINIIFNEKIGFIQSSKMSFYALKKSF